MTNLAVQGPPQLDLRWGQRSEERTDGRLQRAFHPRTEHQEADGYLHPGVTAAAVIGAAQMTVGLPAPLRSVAIDVRAPVPLGMDLAAVVDPTRDGGPTVELRVLERPELEDEPWRTAVHGSLDAEGRVELPNEGALRSLATVPVPEPQEHELYPRCFVCGQGNGQGLHLLPGWYAPDTVVSAFTASENMAEDGALPPAMVAALLSCPTLWACGSQLEELGAAAALLTTYEVHFLEPASASTQLRTVGLAAPRSDDLLTGSSALIGEDGRVHAVANASWQALDELPGRDPGRPDPARAFHPKKAGRPQERSDEGWGEPLPGRRETAGPRSERPGDHDRRDAMGVPVERDDPSRPSRSIGGDGGS